MKCGCKIIIDQKALKKYGYLAIKDKEMQIISFCPLHSAAEEMLTMLKEEHTCAVESMTIHRVDEPNCVTCAVIAKAEGK